jgi:hypothetical protein
MTVARRLSATGELGISSESVVAMRARHENGSRVTRMTMTTLFRVTDQ